jgi:hypothetical protein
MKIYNKKYPWKHRLVLIKLRCNNPRDKAYKWYGKRGIKGLITEEEIKKLWFRDKAYLMIRPTIDRKDNNGNYTYKNCQFIEQSLNSKKDKYKVILQYTLTFKLIKIWPSLQAVVKSLPCDKSSLIQCLKGRTKTVKRFIWKYQKT